LALISGGETVVNMTGSGKGGRNQELALSFLANHEKIQTKREWLLLSVGTDGIDGPTDAAGGIIDSISVNKMNELNLDVTSYLDNNNSYNFLKEVDSLYITGPSGTNVADIQLILVK
jgi:hydroxypyruvate reductase